MGSGPMADPIDPYKILQVDSEAEDEVIQAAYRRLARKYHPDLAETPEAAARMAAINAAWELIGDPAARAAFDRKRGSPRRAGRRRPAARAGRGARLDPSGLDRTTRAVDTVRAAADPTAAGGRLS